MLTSDEPIIDGTRYRIHLTGDGGVTFMDLALSSSQFGELVRAWKVAEARNARRLDFDELVELMVLALVRDLGAREGR